MTARETPSAQAAPRRRLQRLALFLGAVRESPGDFLGDYYLWGNILYTFAAAGYFACDFTGAYLSTHGNIRNVGYILLALIYLVDAIMYWLSWSGAWPHPDNVSIAAEYLNILASLGYVCTSVMYIFEYSSGAAAAEALMLVLIIETCLAFIFVVDAICYAWAWYTTAPPVKGRGCAVSGVCGRQSSCLVTYRMFCHPMHVS
jgi:hypothetical protein